MQKSNSGFYAALAVLISLASLFYTYKYILPQYQKNQSDIAKVDKEISAAKIKYDSLQSTKNSLDQLGDIVDKLFIAVPEDKDTPNLITELEVMAAKYKMVIPSIQIADSTTAGTAAAVPTGTASTLSTGINPVSVSFALTGDFTQLSQFLAQLEKDIRFTNVKSITLASSEGNDMSFSVQVEVYKRTATAVAGAVTP